MKRELLHPTSNNQAMAFDLKNKVSIVTGGASGIGLCCVKELLMNEARGVIIADVNEGQGKLAVNEIKSEFGEGKCAFIKTDVSDYNNFESTFTQTLQMYGNVDILINNAGICNDSIWEKEVAVNVNGTINGVLLGLENFILNHKTGNEGVIINVSSIRGVQPSGDRPIYAATKFAIHGMSLAWGSEDHYKRTKIKVVAVCPGSTSTPLIAHPQNTNLGGPYEEIRKKNQAMSKLPNQTPDACGKSIIEIIKTAKSGTVWIAESGEKYEYKLPDRFGMKHMEGSSL